MNTAKAKSSTPSARSASVDFELEKFSRRGRELRSATRGGECVYFGVVRQCRSGQRAHKEGGAGKLKAILYTLLFLLLIYSAFKIVPAYVSDYQLTDKMQEQARFAIVNRYTDEQIRDNVYKIIQDLEIPAKREDIKVSATQSGVKIWLDYTVPVDLFFYHTELHFSPSSENKSLT